MEKVKKAPKKEVKAPKKAKKAPITEVKTRKIQLSSRKSLLASKAYLENLKADFDYVTSGNVNRLIFGEKEFVFVDKTESGGRGHHLNRMFMADVDAWLLKNKGKKMKFYNNDYTEQMFNLQGIKKHIGKELTMIDVNNCYWRTAYKLGYITEITYIKGLKNKHWKIGRNACIGALIKTKVIQGYTMGKADPSKRRVVRTPPEYHSIRNHIIGHIYKMFKYLFDTMGDNFCMFLTDCIVTTYDRKKQVDRFFSEEGYKTKSKPIEFISLEEHKARRGGKVTWYDDSAKQEGSTFGKEKYGVTRYYLYAQNQVVVSNQVG